jgi:hypothetical protein
MGQKRIRRHPQREDPERHETNKTSEPHIRTRPNETRLSETKVTERGPKLEEPRTGTPKSIDRPDALPNAERPEKRCIVKEKNGVVHRPNTQTNARPNEEVKPQDKRGGTEAEK